MEVSTEKEGAASPSEGTRRPAFSWEEELDGITVRLTAKSGILPEDTMAEISALYESTPSIAFSIALFDADGEAVSESGRLKGKLGIEVSGSSLEEMESAADALLIERIDEEGNAEELQRVLMTARTRNSGSIRFQDSDPAAYRIQKLRRKTDAIRTEEALLDAVKAAGTEETELALSADLELTKTLMIESGQTIIINGGGYSINAAADAGIKVEEGGSLRLAGGLKLNGGWISGDASTEITHTAPLVFTEGKLAIEDTEIFGYYKKGQTADRRDGAPIEASGENAELTLSDGAVVRDNYNDADKPSTPLPYMDENAAAVLCTDGAKLTVSEGSAVSGNEGVFCAIVNVVSAEILIEGGSISENQLNGLRGYENGGGGLRLVNASLSMTGGEFSGNSVEGEGGAIFSVSSNLSIAGGIFCNNSASGMGGAVTLNDYGYQAHPEYPNSKLQLSGGEFYGNRGSAGGAFYVANDAELTATNIAIYRNEAFSIPEAGSAYLGAGGGVWFCPYGNGKFYATRGGMILGNSADMEAGKLLGAGSDIYLADDWFGSPYDERSEVYIADRTLTGARVSWYKDERDKRYTEENHVPAEKFYYSEVKTAAALKGVLHDGLAAEEEIAEHAYVKIHDNSAIYGGGLAVNGTLIIGKRDADIRITVKKQWDDGGAEAERPKQITAVLLQNGAPLEKVVLSEENGWKETISELPSEDPDGAPYDYSVTDDTEGYSPEAGTLTETGENEYEIVLTNKKIRIGSLIVRKLVERGDREKDFAFSLVFDDRSLNGNFGDLSLENGKSEPFYLKHGESVCADGLPAGTGFQIIELEHDGYTVKTVLSGIAEEDTQSMGSVTVNGEIVNGEVKDGDQRSGVIAEEKNTVVVFINTQKPETPGGGGGGGNGGGGGGGGGGKTPGKPVTPKTEEPESADPPHPEINRLPVMGLNGPGYAGEAPKTPGEMLSGKKQETENGAARSAAVIDALKPLYAQNAELAGWLTVPGTDGGYPVMYTPNSWEYYMHHDFDRSSHDVGLPFMGEATEIGGDNTLIHGHNVNNRHQFGWIWNYQDPDFRKMHPTIDYKTIYDAEGQYEVMAVFFSPVYPAEQTGVFKWYQYVGKLNRSQFEAYVSKAKAASLYDTGVSAAYGDKLITLETCASYTTNERLVVVARKKQI